MKKWLLFIILMIPAFTYAEKTLIDAVTNGDVVYIKNYKGDINKPVDASGYTFLMGAVQYNQSNAVKALIEAKVDVNAKNADRVTALMIAAYLGYTDIVKILIESKASVNESTKDGWSALMNAAYAGQVDVVKELIKSRADVNLVDKDRWTALMNAAQMGHVQIVKALIDSKADLDRTNKDGFTALMLACHKGKLDVVRELIKAKANLNIVNINGQTALMGSVMARQKEVIQELINAKADIKIEDKWNQTAYSIAVQKGYMDIASQLEDAGVKSLKQNSYRKLPLYDLDDSVAKKEGRILVFGMVSNNTSILIRSVDNGKVLMNKAYKLNGEVWLKPGEHIVDTMCYFDYDGMQTIEPSEPLTITIETNHYYILKIGEKKEKYMIECESVPGKLE